MSSRFQLAIATLFMLLAISVSITYIYTFGAIGFFVPNVTYALLLSALFIIMGPVSLFFYILYLIYPRDLFFYLTISPFLIDVIIITILALYIFY